MNYKLSPSDLTFLYQGCKRCFYMKMVHGIPQPSIPLPAVFTQIANLLKNHYHNKLTSLLHPALPPGRVSHGEQRIKSQVIKLPNHEDTCYIAGRFDIVVSFHDDTYGIIDFKTGKPKDDSTSLYCRQLQAYAYALEHPAKGALSLSPVSKLGLLYFYPDRVSQENIERLAYEANITWTEIVKDDNSFLRFIDEVLDVLELPEAPEHSPNCQWCGYIGRLNMSNDF
jgi:hypothetical protein